MIAREMTDYAINLINRNSDVLGTLNGKRILCALSGGPDSVALAFCLKESQEKFGFLLAAAHLNHNLRPEAAEEADFVQKLCDSWEIECKIGSIDVNAIAKEQGCGIEMAAREARYGFLLEAANELNCPIIAVAHHMDDQAETFFLNASRGSGLAGLRGMEMLHGIYWRPFLDLRREDVMVILKENDLPYAVDSSNDSLDYARNRLRKIMPEIEKLHGASIENIARTMKNLSFDEEALQSWTDIAWKETEYEGRLSCQKIQSFPAAIQVRLLLRLANSRGLKKDLSRKNIEDLIALMGKQSGRSIDLTASYLARIEHGYIDIKKRETERPSEKPYELWNLCLDGETLAGTRKFFCERKKRPKKLGQNWPESIEANPNELNSAVLRRRKEGDWILPLGAPGRKKWKKYCIDKKMPRSVRDALVLADGNEILWAPGWVMSQRLDASNCEEILAINYSEQE